MHVFVENNEGVHLMGYGIGGEFTVCGQSFDAPETEECIESTGTSYTQTKKRTVTCRECVAVIKHLKGVRIK